MSLRFKHGDMKEDVGDIIRWKTDYPPYDDKYILGIFINEDNRYEAHIVCWSGFAWYTYDGMVSEDDPIMWMNIKLPLLNMKEEYHKVLSAEKNTITIKKHKPAKLSLVGNNKDKGRVK